MYKIKETAGRISSMTGALALLLGIGTSMFPVSLVSADALNPLTERSLTLTSSSPGFHYLDASGNSRYAPAGSGNNGKQTGEIFKFKVSSGTAIKAMTFQFCTDPAGLCKGPGNDADDMTGAGGTYQGHLSDTGDGIGAGTSDFNANFPSASEGYVDPDPVDADGIPTAHTSTDNFGVFTGATPSSGTLDSGWTLAASNKEDKTGLYASQYTNKNNFITLTRTSGSLSVSPGDELTVQFYGTDTNFITNPGAGAFFAKINTFDTNTNTDTSQPDDGHAIDPTWVDGSGNHSPHLIDGGVTVANVMNDSVQIQTKVLETMSFSVGTTNPDADTSLSGAHGTCHPITKNDPINLGNPNAEYSLATTRAYDGYSYWRLSSNSSNGATVYYSGYTLHNTENDHIASIFDTLTGAEGDGSQSASVLSSEQFGLGVEAPDAAGDTDGVVANNERAADVADTAGGAADLGTLGPLAPTAAYADAEGLINNGNYTGHLGNSDPNSAKFAFKDTSLTSPVALATEPDQVIHCSTARMRYVANIAPDTPAGIYTSKVNYIASPEY